MHSCSTMSYIILVAKALHLFHELYYMSVARSISSSDLGGIRIFPYSADNVNKASLFTLYFTKYFVFK